jgi:hypothetical protein
VLTLFRLFDRFVDFRHDAPRSVGNDAARPIPRI